MSVYNRTPGVAAPTTVRLGSTVNIGLTGSPGGVITLQRRYSGVTAYSTIRTIRLDALGRALVRFAPARSMARRAADSTRPTTYSTVRVTRVG